MFLYINYFGWILPLTSKLTVSFLPSGRIDFPMGNIYREMCHLKWCMKGPWLPSLPFHTTIHFCCSSCKYRYWHFERERPWRFVSFSLVFITWMFLAHNSERSHQRRAGIRELVFHFQLEIGGEKNTTLLWSLIYRTRFKSCSYKNIWKAPHDSNDFMIRFAGWRLISTDWQEAGEVGDAVTQPISMLF